MEAESGAILLGKYDRFMNHLRVQDSNPANVAEIV